MQLKERKICKKNCLRWKVYFRLQNTCSAKLLIHRFFKTDSLKQTKNKETFKKLMRNNISNKRETGLSHIIKSQVIAVTTKVILFDSEGTAGT